MKKLLKWTVLGAAMIALFCVLFLYWLVNTQSGLRWLVSQVPQEVLSIESITGDLHHFSFKGLSISSKDKQVKMNVSKGELRFTLSELLSKKLSVRALKASHVSVITSAIAKDSGEGFQPWTGIHLPIDISLKSLIVDDITVFQDSQLTMQITQVSASASIINNQLDLASFRLEQNENTMSLEGSADLSASLDGTVSLKHSLFWLSDESVQVDSVKKAQPSSGLETAKLPNNIFDGGAFKAFGVIQGSWQSLEVLQNIDSPWPMTIQSSIKGIVSNHIQWDAKITTQARGDQRLFGQNVDLGEGRLTSKGSFSPALGLKGVQTSLKGQIEIANQGLPSWLVDVDVLLDKNLLQVNSLSIDEKPSSTRSLEQIELSQLMHFDVKGEVKKLSDFFTQSLTASKGTIGGVDLDGQLSNARWPLNSESPTAQVNGKFSIKGSSDKYSIDTTLEGNVKDAALNAQAQLIASKQELLLEALRINSGRTKVDISGSIGSNIQVDWQLNSPDISEILPIAHGDIASKGTLSGTRDKPTVIFDANSDQLGVFGYSAEEIAVQMNASLASAVEKISATISAKNIQNENSILASTTTMSVNGVVSDHDLVANTVFENDANLAFRANGAWQDKKWLGEISSLDFSDPVLALWKLVDPVEISVSSQTFDVAQGCLRNEQGLSGTIPQVLCFQASKNEKEILVDAQLEAFSLDNLNQLFKLSELTVNGTVDGSIRYLERNGSTAVIDSDMQSNDISLFWSETIGETTERKSLDIEKVNFQISQRDSLMFDALIDLPGSDVLNAKVDIDSAVGAADFQQAPISGSAKLLIERLDALPTSLLNELSLNGQLNADVIVSGTVGSPELEANVDVKGASAKVNQLGLLLQEIELNARTENQSKIEVSGQIKSGNGLLRIDGDVDFSSLQTPLIELDLKGDSIQLANTSELAVVGDVDVKLAIDKQLIKLSGEVNVDEAELDFKVSEYAVLASNDVILLGTEEKKTFLKQQLDLTVNLGQKTHILAQGLDAMLRGKVRVFQVPEGIIRAEGNITIDQGKYTAYGQDLSINNGRLLFNGGSIDNPNIELRALKVLESTTAGVSVGGSASAPRLSLFSSPSMPDQDVLSFLVFGKAVSALGSQDLITLARIANSLRGGGQSNVSKVTQGIQQKLGLTDFDLQFSDQAASITAGKQLSSKFYIGYGFGLLDATQSLFLRYKLNDAWSIKADVGADSGADLRYQIER